MNDSENNIKEIDLYLLIKEILTFLNRKKVFLIPLFTVGVGLAYFQIKHTPNKYNNYYQTQFYIKSSLLTNEEMHTLINNLAINYQSSNKGLATSIKRIDPKKELSIDGLRSDIKIEILLFSPQKLESLTSFIKSHIESSAYYKLKHDSVYNQQTLILNLLNSKLLDLGFDIYNDELAIQLKEKANDDVKLYLDYVSLVEKKTEADLKLGTLDNSIEFLPVEPVNKLIDTFRLKMLLYVGYGLFLSTIGVIVLVVLNFLEQLKTKK